MQNGNAFPALSKGLSSSNSLEVGGLLAQTDFALSERLGGVLTSAYLAPVQYYEILATRRVWIESHEHYIKQTYRNRCHIATANGVMPLTIPVEKPSGKCATRDVRISAHENWQELHLRAIEAAYNSSPFLEYYKDDFLPFYTKKWDFLFDFNTEMQQMILGLLGLEADIHFTGNYETKLPEGIEDLRDTISPKKDTPYNSAPYYQVFELKFGFLSNMSIIDLLFNMGNEAVLFLNRESRKNQNNLTQIPALGS